MGCLVVLNMSNVAVDRHWETREPHILHNTFNEALNTMKNPCDYVAATR